MLKNQVFGRSGGGGEKYDTQITIMRVILVVLVVIGHGIFYTIDTNFGGIYIYEAMNDAGIKDTAFHELLLYVSSFIYSFHMPAFFSVSGMLFFRQIEKGRYRSLKSLAVIKFKRLIVPLIFTWMIVNIPIKWISGYYKDLEHPFFSALFQVLVPYDVYLWYLESLFLVFILAYIIEGFCRKHQKVGEFIFPAALLICGIIVQKVLGKMLILGNPIKYVFWFYMGKWIDQCRFPIKSRFQRLINIAAFFAAYVISLNIPHGGWIIRETITPFIGTILLWDLCANILSMISQQSKDSLNNAASYAFGIYLYADPINYLILWGVNEIIGVCILGSELGAIAVFLSRILLSTAFAFWVVWILKKINLKICLY